jgi:hypothetical protein
MKTQFHVSKERLEVLQSVTGLVTNVTEQEVKYEGMSPYIAEVEINTTADLHNLFKLGITIGWNKIS